MDYVFRNVKPWYSDINEEHKYLPKCCYGHDLEYVDFILEDKAGAEKILAPVSKKFLCIHYNDTLLKDTKLT